MATNPRAPPRSTSPPVASEEGVKNLRARFERNKSSRAQTPAEFLAAQKAVAEKEAQEILLARKKVAAFNMAVRQLELTREAAKHEQTPQQVETREKLRREARRVSTVLRELDHAAVRPAEETKERRATNLVLAEMAEEFEKEMQNEERLALEEEAEAKRRAEATEAASRKAAEDDAARLAAEAEQARKEAEMAAESARLAREEAERAAHAEAQALARAQADAAEKERQRAETEAAELRAAELRAAETRAAEARDAEVKAAAEAEAKAKAEREAQARAAELKAQMEAEEKDRQILTAYLRENYPEKLGEVEPLLQQFKGNLDVLFEELSRGQTFKESAEQSGVDDDDGSVVAAPETAGDITPSKPAPQAGMAGGNKKFLKPGVDVREVITRFYTIFAASKLNDIDEILRHFENREADLFRTLEVKYDVSFNTDGECTPNDGDRVGGESFNTGGAANGNGAAGASSNSKFAVDVQQFTLKERLSKNGASPDKISAVLASGSGMM